MGRGQRRQKKREWFKERTKGLSSTLKGFKQTKNKQLTNLEPCRALRLKVIKMLVSKERDNRQLGKSQTKQTSSKTATVSAQAQVDLKLNQGSRYKSAEEHET